MQMRSFWLSKEVFIGLIFGLLLAVPVFVFGGSKVVYVDNDAKGDEEGTASRPYHSISKALKNAKGGTEVRVKNGTYEENITIPKGVKLFGDSEKRDKVIIESDSDDKPTVTMKDDTEISHVTIKGGRHGVRIVDDAKAHIFDAVIKKSNRDGIHIDSASRDKKHRVLIDDVEVKDNDRAGIFSEKRFIVLINSNILQNGSDGIDFALGTKAWLEKNRFNDNRGSGAKLALDGASIFGKKNDFRHNKREGVEVAAYGAAGTIELKKSEFVGNNHYGVARIARSASGAQMFGNLSFGIGTNDSRFEANVLGGLSSVLRNF